MTALPITSGHELFTDVSKNTQTHAIARLLVNKLYAQYDNTQMTIITSAGNQSVKHL